MLPGERFHGEYALVRLFNEVIFAAARRLARPTRTREEWLRARYGPSRALVVLVVAVWVLVLVLLAHLVVLVLHGRLF